MSDLTRVRTAGVLLRYDGRFVFQLGPEQHGAGLGIARLGGHVEAGELPVECAVREAREEAGVAIELEDVPTTFGYQAGERPLRLVDATGRLPVEVWAGRPPRPLLLGSQPERGPSVTYLADTSDLPVPRTESCALVHLDVNEVALVCNGLVTLGQLVDAGGRVAMTVPLSRDAVLRPRDQLLALDHLIALGALDRQP